MTKRRRSVYPKDKLVNAIRAVANKKMTSLQASRLYGVPSSTIRSHLSDQTLRIGAGRPCYLTKKKEAYLVEVIKSLATIGIRLTRVVVHKIAGEYLRLVQKDSRLRGKSRYSNCLFVSVVLGRTRAKRSLDDRFLEAKQASDQNGQGEEAGTESSARIHGRSSSWMVR